MAPPWSMVDSSSDRRHEDMDDGDDDDDDTDDDEPDNWILMVGLSIYIIAYRYSNLSILSF